MALRLHLALLAPALAAFSAFAQATSPPPSSLQATLAQAVADGNQMPTTLADWTRDHPGEIVESPDEVSLYPSADWSVRELEGRWCLRSTAPEITLPGGVHVRRVAIFDPPRVEFDYQQPLPPLPTTSGEVLRRQGCRLTRILYMFTGMPDPHALASAIAGDLAPLHRADDSSPPFAGTGSAAFWNWTANFFHRGQPFWDAGVAISGETAASGPRSPAVLVLVTSHSLSYGPPPSDLIQARAGQPWLALRAAQMAQQPEASTLAMLGFLAPRVRDNAEQAPLACNTQLIPVVRDWLRHAADSPPQRHAAALILADQVLTARLGDCSELAGDVPYEPPQPTDPDRPAYDALLRSLQALNIGTTATREGPYYTGTLAKEAQTLAPNGPAGELAGIARIDDPCSWATSGDWPLRVAAMGESLLRDFPRDAWTPSIHLILAEAWALAAERASGQIDPPPAISAASAVAETLRNYRAWYDAGSDRLSTDRDRRLVWREIWDLQAGLPPRLLLPECSMDDAN